ncbi:hypothetical protein GCM10010423_64850 [Streptomyces levis]|uniref:Uncharacterized protein n=1 Tax=Streptomyces levis TaxID=285566 RepID=A0ABN3P2D7_9ACTN
MRESDKDFFWPRLEVLEKLANSIDYFTDEAMLRNDEDFTKEERTVLHQQAREVQKTAEEMVKRLTMPGVYSQPVHTSRKRVVRFKRKKGGSV